MRDIGEWVRQSGQHIQHAFAVDWRGSRHFLFMLILLIVSSAATASFYIGQPGQPEFSYDTPSYLTVTQHILANGNLVDPLRTPGYPFLVALVFLVAGAGNFLAVSLVQGVLFVLATLEVYVLTVLLLRKSWVAFAVGLLVGTNTYLLSFVKPIIVEGFALWLTVSLALAVVLFIQTVKPGYLWLVAGFMLVLFMTRPEWIYLPAPLFAYLLIATRRHGKLRRLLLHGIVAVVLLYSVLGLFIYANATQNGYAGISYVQNINMVGKVLQYHMQDEAPPQYAAVAREVDSFAAHGGWNPYNLVHQYPPIAANQWSLGGAYASSVIEGHPIQFLVDTIVTFFTSSDQYRAFAEVDAHGPVATPPLKAQVAFSAYVARTYRFFPLFALLWGVLLFWRRASRLGAVEAMAAVILIALYELALTTIAGYSNYDYARFHVPFDPLMIIVIWGTVLASLPLWEGILMRLRLSGRVIWWVWGVVIVSALVGSVLISWITLGINEAANPQSWLVVQLLLTHPPRILTVLALAVLITFLSYRADRRLQKIAGESDLCKDVEARVL